MSPLGRDTVVYFKIFNERPNYRKKKKKQVGMTHGVKLPLPTARTYRSVATKNMLTILNEHRHLNDVRSNHRRTFTNTKMTSQSILKRLSNERISIFYQF